MSTSLSLSFLIHRVAFPEVWWRFEPYMVKEHPGQAGERNLVLYLSFPSLSFVVIFIRAFFLFSHVFSFYYVTHTLGGGVALGSPSRSFKSRQSDCERLLLLLAFVSSIINDEDCSCCVTRTKTKRNFHCARLHLAGSLYYHCYVIILFFRRSYKQRERPARFSCLIWT